MADKIVRLASPDVNGLFPSHSNATLLWFYNGWLPKNTLMLMQNSAFSIQSATVLYMLLLLSSVDNTPAVFKALRGKKFLKCHDLFQIVLFSHKYTSCLSSPFHTNEQNCSSLCRTAMVLHCLANMTDDLSYDVYIRIIPLWNSFYTFFEEANLQN